MSRSVQSLERGLLVLERLVARHPAGVTELAAELGLDKTIVHRLLYTLHAQGYVEQDANRKYLPGQKLLRIGAQTLVGLDVRALALPYMQQLAAQAQGVAHLAKWVESRAIYIERVQSPGLRLVTTDVGGEAPGHCSAAGKVLWAYLPQSELTALLRETQLDRHTANTIHDPFELQRHLAEVRRQGYAVDEEEHRLGLIGIGAPIFDYTGAVVASICVGETTPSSDAHTRAERQRQVREAAHHLSLEMGYLNDDLGDL